ncbi:hypothetical protein ZHAS_00022169 [Anopheles sinensis]|uniref:Uncharacterized protein n=1 Tax=Anopheles sinensis TaxID=74873 RepID=A0A084WUN2_ANOSI|nr:hypothetical protein ZHAS_00022169 [Anopheles sinensis]
MGVCTLSDIDLAFDGLYALSFMPSNTSILRLTRAKGNIDFSQLRFPDLLTEISLQECPIGLIIFPPFHLLSALSFINVRVGYIKFLEGGITFKDIRIRHTPFTEIPPPILGLVNLVRLDLTYSRMRQLSLDAIAGLGQLEELNVSHNRITTITMDDGWKCCRKLSILRLDGNRLVKFDFGLVLHMPRLYSLVLRQNRLTTLTCTVDTALAEKHNFCSWRSYFLAVRSGNGTAPQPSCSDFFANLQLIDLTYNKLTVLEMASFEWMSALQDCRTAFNKIVNVKVESNRIPMLLNLSSLNNHLGYIHFLPKEVFSTEN